MKDVEQGRIEKLVDWEWGSFVRVDNVITDTANKQKVKRCVGVQKSIFMADMSRYFSVVS